MNVAFKIYPDSVWGILTFVIFNGGIDTCKIKSFAFKIYKLSVKEIEINF